MLILFNHFKTSISSLRIKETKLDKMRPQSLVNFILTILLVSCSGSPRNIASDQPLIETDSISFSLKYSESYFVVPSPIQTSILLRDLNLGFKDDLIMSAISVDKFTTTTKKSLALGLIGADISYLNLYDQRDQAIKHLQIAKDLINDLEITPAFDNHFLKKIELNIGNNDSIISYLSEVYRKGDLYLKANERRDICSLIIAGGWIESSYFISQLYKQKQQQEIFNLILYQRDILENLIKILSPFYKKSPEYTHLIDNLVNIAYEFDVVDEITTVNLIETDTAKKITHVTNQCQHIMTGSKMDKLSSHIENLRNEILL